MAVRTKQLSRSTIEGFLAEMKCVLLRPDFNIRNDFLFVEQRASDDIDDAYNNVNTMLELEYDSQDVVEELKTLTIREYCESMVDTVTQDMNFLHVFGRKIQGRDVYIKVRMKQKSQTKKMVLCISFHFSRFPMGNFPYR